MTRCSQCGCAAWNTENVCGECVRCVFINDRLARRDLTFAEYLKLVKNLPADQLSSFRFAASATEKLSPMENHALASFLRRI